LLTVLISLSVIGLLLVAVAAALYSYNTLTQLESGAGFLLLLAAAVGLWIFRRRAMRQKDPTQIGLPILVGLALGLLWAVEIGINNFLAPPLPARDIIDNLFWAAIALSILVLVILRAWQTGSLWRALEAGVWSGFTSGLVACVMALVVIVFGMRFLMQDPLNLAEWAAQVSKNTAPAMSDYFAYETFAGAFGHLLVLGIAMGGLLGALGGLLVKGIQRVTQPHRPPQPSRHHRR
jgi:hypothetical protein